jgi:hypothetical protein
LEATAISLHEKQVRTLIDSNNGPVDQRGWSCGAIVEHFVRENNNDFKRSPQGAANFIERLPHYRRRLGDSDEP